MCTACALLLALHIRRYHPFIADDALISLRYARRLIDGHGLTWNLGERVEGYSNLLWILLSAGLGALGLDLIVAVRVLGFVAAVAAIAAVTYAHPPTRLPTWLPALAGGMALALAGPIAVWSVGGLEQTLVAALLAWALVLGYRLVDDDEVAGRAWLAPGILLALLCWTRPDGPIFTAGICAGILLARGIRRETVGLCGRLALLPLVAVSAQLLFRLGYYGDVLPNSAYAKVAFTSERLRSGLSYTGVGLVWLAALALPALLAVSAAWRDEATSRRARFLAVPLLVWGLYVSVIGGDIFPGRRHLVPLIVMLALMLAQGLEGLMRSGHRVRFAAWATVPVALAALAFMQHRDPENLRARSERWEWDGQVIGSFLKRAFGHLQPLLAADAAGTLPYFSELPSIDMLGINDRYLAHHRPSDFGRVWLGHDLGDGRYVLGRKPDLVMFFGPEGGALPNFRSGKEMFDDPEFTDRYRLVAFEADEPYTYRSRVWVRAEEGKLGILRETNRVTLPGYLFMANRSSVAKLDRNGRPAVIVVHGTPAGFRNLRLEPGRWRVTLEGSGDPVTVGARAGERSDWQMATRLGLTFDVREEDMGRHELLVVTAPGETAYISRVILDREVVPAAAAMTAVVATSPGSRR